MKVPFNDLGREYLVRREELDAAVRRVLSRGRYILADEVSSFEEEFARWLGAPACVGVASGTDALILTLLASGLRPGEGVVVPAMTAPATGAAICAAGGRPVFVDVSADTLTLDPEQVAETLRRDAERLRIRVLLPVHLYGHPADLEPLQALARRYGLKLIEDVAQATGATCGGRRVGSLGDFGCFSFYPTKNLGAFGDGGMIAVRDPSDAERLRRLRSYGESRKGYCVEHGINSRLDELQAALLRVKLPYVEEDNRRRRAIASAYREVLRETALRAPQERPGAVHVFHLYVVRTAAREQLEKGLAERGVGTAIHYPYPLHLQPAFSAYAEGAGALPVAERAAQEILSIPLNPRMDERETMHVCESLRQLAPRLPPTESTNAHGSGSR